MENSVDAPQKVKNSMYVCVIQVYDPAIPTFGYTSKRNENRLSKRSLHSYVYGSSIHSSQDMETIYMSVNRWMDREVAPPHTHYSAMRRRKSCLLQQYEWTLKSITVR